MSRKDDVIQMMHDKGFYETSTVITGHDGKQLYSVKFIRISDNKEGPTETYDDITEAYTQAAVQALLHCF